MKSRVFSGIKATGHLHLGNYLGALSQWVKHQDSYDNIFCIVDLHSITVPIEPTLLHKLIRETASWYLACGIDPNKSILFVQSQNKDHAQLGWILNTMTSVGQLNRMTQFKDKSEKSDFIGAGLLNYPTLMAADILLYDTHKVPVGDDQKQHIELTRDIAERFNNRFGETFVVPEYMPPPVGARIMSLQNPSNKMAKSESDPMGTIDLSDNEELVRKKIGSAVTDQGNEIVLSEDKPGIANLMSIMMALTDQTPEELDTHFSGKGYKVFKDAVADAVIETLQPLQERFRDINESDVIENILQEGKEAAQEISNKKMIAVEKVIGLGL